jgi:hypothetical protein
MHPHIPLAAKHGDTPLPSARQLGRLLTGPAPERGRHPTCRTVWRVKLSHQRVMSRRGITFRLRARACNCEPSVTPCWSGWRRARPQFRGGFMMFNVFEYSTIR